MMTLLSCFDTCRQIKTEQCSCCTRACASQIIRDFKWTRLRGFCKLCIVTYSVKNRADVEIHQPQVPQSDSLDGIVARFWYQSSTLGYLQIVKGSLASFLKPDGLSEL